MNKSGGGYYFSGVLNMGCMIAIFIFIVIVTGILFNIDHQLRVSGQ